MEQESEVVNNSIIRHGHGHIVHHHHVTAEHFSKTISKGKKNYVQFQKYQN